MISDKLVMLSEEDAQHDALTEIFETRCPPVALESFVRVLKANEASGSGQAAKRERIATLQSKRRDWLSSVQAAQRDIDRGEGVHPSEMKKCEANRKKVAGADKEIAALRSEQPTPNLPAETLAEFLVESRGKFVAAPVEAKLQKGQTPPEALTASRANREALVRKRIETSKEPLPIEDVLARLRADVNRNSQAPDFGPITKVKPQHREHALAANRRPDAQGHVAWPTHEEIFEGGRRGELELGIRFACWLFPDAIIERGTAELKKLYGGKKGLSIADRARLLAEIEGEILMEERREEAFVRMCEDAGFSVYRRPLANPLAVLGIKPA
jgi:hypothetical protein